MGNDLTNSYNSTSAFVGNSIEVAFNTPIKQQFTNFVNFLDQPTTLEMGLTLYATGRLPFKESSLGTARHQLHLLVQLWTMLLLKV